MADVPTIPIFAYLHPAFCDNIDGPGEYYSKWNIPYDLVYMWSLINNKFLKSFSVPRVP